MCVALGVFAASYEISGRTPLAHLKGLWQQQAPHLDAAGAHVKDTATDLAGEMKRQVTTPGPREHHSADERDSVNRIIARRQQKE